MATEEFSFNSFNVVKRKKFIDALREGKNLSGASKVAGVSRVLTWAYRRKYPEFEEKVQEALETGTQLNIVDVEDALLTSAKGGNVTAIQVYLYNRCPERWRDKRNAMGIEDVLSLLSPAVRAIVVKDLRRVAAGAMAEAASPETAEGIGGSSNGTPNNNGSK